jgi:AcrR family transcriptional regulator
MQKLAKVANVSPRTIYLKYADKEDMLVKLFVDEVIGAYEKAALENFSVAMNFAAGIKLIWQNCFAYFKLNKHAFSLFQYGKSSPLLNKAYKERNIAEGQYFAPIYAFLKRHADAGVIKHFPIEVYRALLFAPMLDLVNEYFEHLDRPKQVITDELFSQSCDAVIAGILQ